MIKPWRLLCLALPLAAADINPFTAPAVAPDFKDVQATSQYIAMPDGVRIAIDVILPKDLPAGRRIPAILKITRYGRADSGGAVSAYDRFFVTRGYARVLIDERGTGASFGTVRYGKATLGDLRQMVEWVTLQPWSNGRVGAIGQSYEGTTAELLAACGHPAVRAVAPLFSDFNYYTDLIRPGGVFGDWLLHTWHTETRAMDAGQGVKRVDADTDGALLKQAVAQHGANPDIYAAGQKAEFLDDAAPAFDGTFRDMNVASLRGEMEKTRVPMLIFAGWMDAGTVQGTLQRFGTFPNPQRIFIGSWSHGAGHHADPFAPSDTAQPTSQQRLWEVLRFFDHYLKGQSDTAGDEPRLYYATMGENQWKSTAAWPPDGLSTVSYFLAKGRALTPAPAKGSLRVSLAIADTGKQNRWHTQLTGNNVIYADVLPKMQSLAAFTTAPLTEAIEVTGQPIARLRLRPSRDDPALIAYLVAIDPHERPIYLTEGHLRLVQREVNGGEQTLHSYLRRDQESAAAGTDLDAVFTLLPTSVLIPKGYRVRLLLAAGERLDFPAPASYTAVLDAGSRLDLPARKRGDARLGYTESAPVAAKLNFTAAWKLNPAASDFSDPHASRPDSMTCTVQQNGNALHYKVDREQGGKKTGFTVDLKIGGAPFESNAAGVVNARWEGDALLVKTMFNPGTPRQAEQEERWSLSVDGRQLTDSFWIRLPDGVEVRVRRVFDKQ
jgi:putative CocE/NonD family hydrolase